MIVSELTGVVRSTTPARPEVSAGVDYDAFLKLLVASMKNQDPTRPNDPAQMLSQLASFSSVEQAIRTNAKLDQLLASAAAGQAAGLIGREIAKPDGTILGRVAAIEMAGGNLFAILEDGRRIMIADGIRIIGS